MDAYENEHQRQIKCGEALKAKQKFKEDCKHMSIDEDSMRRKRRTCIKKMARMYYKSSLCVGCSFYLKENK